jgi:hypothetical protein
MHMFHCRYNSISHIILKALWYSVGGTIRLCILLMTASS